MSKDPLVSIVMPVGVNTELYSGLPAARGIKTAEPEDVAAAIVEALQTGRVDVFVPKSVGRLMRSTNLVPRRVAEFISRALKADQVESARIATHLTPLPSNPTSARPLGSRTWLADGWICDVQRLRTPARRVERLTNIGCVSRPNERLKHVQASPTRKPPITSLGQCAPT